MITMSTSFVNLNIDFTSSLVFFFALTVSCEIWHTTQFGAPRHCCDTVGQILCMTMVERLLKLLV